MTQLASDNFTRANSTGLGANWTLNSAENSSGFDIVSNLAQPHAVGTGGMSDQYSGITWGNDHYSEVTFDVTDNVAVDVGSGPACRMALSGSVNYYGAVGSAAGWGLIKTVSNTPTLVSSGSGTTFAAGDVLRLEFQGTAWRLFKNSVQFASGTDSSLATGSPGITYSDTASAASKAALCLWAGGDFSSAGITITPPVGSVTTSGNTPIVTPAQNTVIQPIVARRSGDLWLLDRRILLPSRRRFLQRAA